MLSCGITALWYWNLIFTTSLEIYDVIYIYKYVHIYKFLHIIYNYMQIIYKLKCRTLHYYYNLSRYFLFLISNQMSSTYWNALGTLFSSTSLKVQFQSHHFFEAFFYHRSYLFLSPLISLYTYKLFGDWHLLTCMVILMCISKAQHFDVERGIRAHLVHQISEVKLYSELFQPTCQINFAWTAPLTDNLISFD